MAAQDTPNPSVLVSPVSTYIQDLNTAKACSQRCQTLIWFSPTLKLWFTTREITEGWFALPSLPTSLPRPHMKVMQSHNKNQMKCHLLLHAIISLHLVRGLFAQALHEEATPKSSFSMAVPLQWQVYAIALNSEVSYIHLKTDTYSCHFSRTEKTQF